MSQDIQFWIGPIYHKNLLHYDTRIHADEDIFGFRSTETLLCGLCTTGILTVYGRAVSVLLSSLVMLLLRVAPLRR